MFSYEDRIRAVRLYSKLGKRIIHVQSALVPPGHTCDRRRFASCP